MIYNVDNPALSDLFCRLSPIGDVKISVSTSGKSPAMAKALRERIEKMITPEDLLEIQFQAHMRAPQRKKRLTQKLEAKYYTRYLITIKLNKF